MSLRIGQRIQLHPGTDRWMMGDRYGEVVGFARDGRRVRVKLDKSGKTMLFHKERILDLDGSTLGEASTELYDELKEAGIEIDHHESDLYVPNTPEARRILDRHPIEKKNATLFGEHKVVGGRHVDKIWIDVPFAYAPFWRKKRRA